MTVQCSVCWFCMKVCWRY